MTDNIIPGLSEYNLNYYFKIYTDLKKIVATCQDPGLKEKFLLSDNQMNSEDNILDSEISTSEKQRYSQKPSA